MPTRYAIRHITRFNYDVAGQREPDGGADAAAHRRHAALPAVRAGVAPRARVFAYRDHLGNSVHHFDTPARHTQLTITARAYVELDPASGDAGSARRRARGGRWIPGRGRGDLWDFLQPSRFAIWTPALRDYVATRSPAIAARTDDPLTTIRTLHAAHPCATSSTCPAARAWTRRSTRRCRRGAASARTSRTS